jgi:hypothetical protein
MTVDARQIAEPAHVYLQSVDGAPLQSAPGIDLFNKGLPDRPALLTYRLVCHISRLHCRS